MRKNTLMITVVCLAIATLAMVRITAATATAPSETTAGSADAASADGIDASAVMELIVSGWPDSALSYLDGAAYRNSNHPMVLILRARAMRENISDEDKDKSLIAVDAEPIVELLDRAIDACDQALARNENDSRYYFYRGHANLWKAQVYTLTRKYWPAGRSAKKAKNDLEKYLEFEPMDPDAQGDLGAFFYFADALPGVAKLVSKLLFFPSGDRDKGLTMLEYGATHDGVFRIDFEIALAAVYVIFEGRLEDASTAMTELIDRYPNYTRLAEPMGVLAPLTPLQLRDIQRGEDTAIRRHLAQHGENANWSLIKRLKLHQDYLDMYFGNPQRAMYGFSALIESPASRPDWVLPMALLNRGTLYSMMGDDQAARSAFIMVRDNQWMSHYNDTADKLLDDDSQAADPVNLDDLAFVPSIYSGRIARAQNALDEYRDKRGTDVMYYFYSGELNIFKQEFEAAAISYDAALQLTVPNCEQGYQMFAALRLAEIHGHELRYDIAIDYIELATSYTHATYLFEYSMFARKRFYQLLEDGVITEPPSILFYQAPDRSVTKRSSH